MTAASLDRHRARATHADSVLHGTVRFAPLPSLWLTAMLAGAVTGALCFFSWTGLLLFAAGTAIVLLFGHSLGSHRKLIHDSFECPQWLEYALVPGVLVGLSGRWACCASNELRDMRRAVHCHPICVTVPASGVMPGGNYSAAWISTTRRTSPSSRASRTTAFTVSWKEAGCCSNCHGPCCSSPGAAGAWSAGASARGSAPACSAIG